MEEVTENAEGPYFGPLEAPVPLDVTHDVSGFDCGVEDLNDWLRNRALKNEGRFSRTYVVCVKNKVVAFYCISAGSVQRSDAPGKLRRNAPDAIPVSIIGRLAVSQAYAGKGIRSDILADAMNRIAHASQKIGIGAVLVQAKDDASKRFYMSCADFLPFPESGRTLFLPIDTLIAAYN